MARYQYAGPGPQVTSNVGEITGAILRPGDIREFDAEPSGGPWECLDPQPEAAGLLRWNGEVTPPPAQLPPSVAPVTPEGM